MSKIADTEANATSLDSLVNDNALVPTLRNGPKPSYQYLVDGWNTEFDALIDNLEVQGDNAIALISADVVTVEAAKNSAISSIDSDLSAFDAYYQSAKGTIGNDVAEFTIDSDAALAEFELNASNSLSEFTIDSDAALADFELNASNSLSEFTIDSDAALAEFELNASNSLSEFTIDSDAALADFAQESAEAFNEFDLTLDQYKESRGFNTKGTFAGGFTYELPNDVGLDADGNPWILIDTSSLPVIVSAGTTPSNPPYKQVYYGTASQVSTNTSDTVQSFVDSFALKIFQSPTDGGLTEIQTRTVDAGEVYEVRKTSDDSLATIYSDAAGTTEIIQNGTSNASDSAGVVEFYIADGDYYVQVGVIKSELFIDKVSSSSLWGGSFVGYFSEGFTYTSGDDVAKGQNGRYYQYIGSDNYPVVVPSGTIAEDFTNLYKIIDISNILTNVESELFYLNLTKEKEAGVLVVRPANGFFSAPASVQDGGGRGRLYNGAFNSLAAAITYARAGDTVRVLAGGYSGNVIFKEGVKVICDEGVVFYNSQFTINNIKGFELLGYPKIVKTDISVTLITLTDCIDYNIEIDSIEIWRPEGAPDIARSGFKSARSGGDLKVRSNSFTLNKQYITIDDEWSNSGNVVNLHTTGNYSQRSAANSNNTDVQPIGVLNGATVNWYVSGVQKSDLNNCIVVGYLTAPPSLTTTTLNVFSNSAIFEPSTGTFLIRGDSANQLAVNEVTIQGVTRHKGSEFARNGNTDTTGSKLKIFGSVYSLNADTTFASTPVESITVTTEA